MKPFKTKDSNIEYHANPAVSRSMLHIMGKSPAHYKWAHDNVTSPTEALKFGTMFHTLVLEPEAFDAKYIIAPQVDKRTKEGKEIYQALSESKKEIVQQSEYESACTMRDNILENKYAKALLQGTKEMSFYWTDELTGIDCKCRPDCMTSIGDMNVIVDLKSCNNAESSAFMKDALSYGYDLQAAQYKTGVELVEQKPYKFVFIVVEKSPPYAINILEADSIFIRKGYDDFRTYLGMLKYCIDTGNWYGYTGQSGRPNILNLPAWLIKDYE